MSPFPGVWAIATVANMPTQTEFDDAARALRATLSTLATSRRHLAAARSADTITGGSVAAVVDAALAVAQANVDELGHRVESLASLCDQRSRACADHVAALARWNVRYELWERAMQRYRSSVDDQLHTAPWPGPAPQRPAAPYAWVAPA